MENRDWFVIFLLVFNGIFVYGRRLFWKRFENCDPNVNYAAMYNVTLKTIGNKQYANATAILTSPFDNTLRLNSSIEVLTGKHYVYLFSINERKSCDAAHRYLGEFMYDLERHGQMIPGMCPIPKGRYQWQNYRLDFEKVTTLANFPFGNLRFTNVVYHRGNGIYTCIVFEIEHSV